MSPDRVVIIGASTTGLFAAAAVAASDRSVVILDRDELPSDAAPRPGVPQGRQPHVFLHRGVLAAEELLPGFRRDLLDVGAVPINTADLAWLGEQGWADRTSRSFEMLSTSRPLLEVTLRRRVTELPGVHVAGGRPVTGLAENGRNWLVTTADGTEFNADLVIDASGRNSRLATWLGGKLSGPPRTTEIDARIGYATRMYRGDPLIGDIPGVVIASTPSTPTGGLAISIEGGHWLIMALGVGDDRPPRGPAGFEAFLGRLRDPALARLAQRLEPVSDVSLHRQTANRRRYYDEQNDWPDGVVVMGDAFCAFNPVYGQGIAVGAAEAVLLREALDAGLKPGASRLLHRQFAKAVALPWAVATATDLQYPTCPQSPTRLGALQDNWVKQLEKPVRTRQRQSGHRTEQHLPPDGWTTHAPATGIDPGSSQWASSGLRSRQPAPGGAAELTEQAVAADGHTRTPCPPASTPARLHRAAISRRGSHSPLVPETVPVIPVHHARSVPFDHR